MTLKIDISATKQCCGNASVRTPILPKSMCTIFQLYRLKLRQDQTFVDTNYQFQ